MIKTPRNDDISRVSYHMQAAPVSRYAFKRKATVVLEKDVEYFRQIRLCSRKIHQTRPTTDLVKDRAQPNRARLVMGADQNFMPRGGLDAENIAHQTIEEQGL